MKRTATKLISYILALAIVCSVLPTTAYARAEFTVYLKHIICDSDGNYLAYDVNGLLKDCIAKLSQSGVWEDFGGQTGDVIDLWITSSDMSDSEKTDRSKAPYALHDDTQKWVLTEIKAEAGNMSGKPLTAIDVKTDDYTIAKSDLPRDNKGRISIFYVWKLVDNAGGGDVTIDTTPCVVTFDLNRAAEPAVGQLPSNLRVEANGDDLAKHTLTATVINGVELDINPREKNTTYTDLEVTGYDLVGWKCGDKTYEPGEVITLDGKALSGGKTTTTASGQTAYEVTFTAQWEKWVLPTPEEIDEYFYSGVKSDGRKENLVLAEEGDAGTSVTITQHIVEDDTHVTSELKLKPDLREIYYEAAVKMNEVVAGNLSGKWVSREDFAQFKIEVDMASQLELIDEDEDGYVEFTFTCSFLKPVQGQEVLVNGKAVEGVTVDSYDQNPYTYKIPVKGLTDDDGKVLPFTFVVGWRGPGGYSPKELKTMTLTTAHVRATSKVPFKTTGKVTGYLNPACLTGNPDARDGLAQIILDGTPTLKNYLENTWGLSREKMIKAMLDYLDSDIGKKTSMERIELDANLVKAWVPCVVTFVDEDGNPVEGANTQEIKCENGNTATEPRIETYNGGRDFDGWFIKGTDTKYDFNTPVTDDLVLEARYSDHLHHWSEWTVTEPTCTEAGSRSHTCAVCGRTDTETLSALGHSWGAWETVTAPTTTSEGLEHRLCARCNAEETRPIAMLTPGPVIPPVDPVTPVNPVAPVNPVTPVDPGTTINDEEVPLANVSGLNDVDHFAYIAGYEDGTVRPANNITRAEVATIFFRLMTEEYRVANWSTTNTFTDAAPSGWYNAAISTAAKAGILKGYADGSVKPNANITRAEFATIAARFISDEITDDGVGDFSDTANHWAAKEIRLAAKAGWVQGDGNRFRPNDPITRAEVMVLVNRMLDRVPDADHMLPGMKTWSDNPEGTWYYADVQEATNDHDYERAEDGAAEIWTALTEAKDWTALEAEWIANNGASAPKAEAETQGLPDGI